MTARATNDDEAALLRELGAGPWVIMLQLADLAEERGDRALAAGWRWLAKWRKWPVANPPGPWRWACAFTDSPDEAGKAASDCLGIRAAGRADRDFADLRPDDLASFFECSARAVGEWLEKVAPEGGT